MSAGTTLSRHDTCKGTPPSPPQFQKRGLCNVPTPVVTSGVTQFAETVRLRPNVELDARFCICGSWPGQPVSISAPWDGFRSLHPDCCGTKKIITGRLWELSGLPTGAPPDGSHIKYDLWCNRNQIPPLLLSEIRLHNTSHNQFSPS